jgi:hypothetical protein
MIISTAVDAYRPWYSFVLEAESIPGEHRAAGRIRTLGIKKKKSNDPHWEQNP